MKAPDSGNVGASGERSASEADAKKDRESGERHGKAAILLLQSGSGLGEQAGAARSAARPAALPCQHSNNYPNSPQPKRYKLRQRATYLTGKLGQATLQTASIVHDVGVAEEDEGLDRDGRHWSKRGDGVTWERIFGGITSAEAKRAFSLRSNVDGFFKHYGREVCGFLTFSPPKGSPAADSPRELAARFNDARKHALKWMRSYFRVLEPRRDGSAHHHLGVATTFDLRPDEFDWDAYRECQKQAPSRKLGRPAGPEFKTWRKKYVESAAPELRACWAELREIGKRFGLGRTEMLPIRKEGGAVAHYVGAYLEGGLAYRQDAWKGVRRIEYGRTESPEWRNTSSAFGWVSEGSTAWRERVGELAEAGCVGFDDMRGLVQRFGPKWAYYWGPSIMIEPEARWRELLLHVALAHGGNVSSEPMLLVGGIVYQRWASLDACQASGPLLLPS